MNYFDKKETNRIEKLENKLFSKNQSFDTDERSEFDVKKYEEMPDWKDGDLLDNSSSESFPINKQKTGIFWTVLVVAILFFLGSLGFAAYMFIGGEQIISTDDINIDIVGPVSVGGGDQLSIDVVVQNNSQINMESTNLAIEYPEGTKSSDLKNDLRRGRIEIGDLSAGSVIKKTLDMAFFGENGETKSVDVNVEYRTPGSVVLLSKTKTFTITLSVSPVQILVTALDKISSGQTMDFNLEIKSNSERPINNLLVIAEYPFGFKYEKANIAPTYGNNVWEFGEFNPTDVKNIKISGQLQAQDNEERAFKFSAGTPKSDNKEEIDITLTNVRHVVLLEKPFIGLDLAINGSSEPIAVVESGDEINYILTFSNNTNNVVRDVEAKLYLEGKVLDKGKILVTSGFYDSYTNLISYTKNTLEKLSSVPPRSSIPISDKLETYDLSVNNKSLVNPEVRISAIVTGLRTSESGVDEKIEERDFVTIKILSDLVFDSKTSYNSQYTKTASFIDSGPVPPKVEQETLYTATWEILNSTNDVETTKVIGLLPTYVTWTGNVYPISEDITYDSTSRRIIWSPGRISAGTGHSAPSRSVSFQLKIRPSISQIGYTPDLVNSISVSSFDAFAKTKIELPGEVTNTLLVGRNAFDKHGDVVQ